MIFQPMQSCAVPLKNLTILTIYSPGEFYSEKNLDSVSQCKVTLMILMILITQMTLIKANDFNDP